METAELVSRLRRAGCVFAEEEAQILRRASRDADELDRLCARREAGEFLEHVVGSLEVLGEHLAVQPGVFVPRQRTALLIEQTLVAARRREQPVVLEAYCGAAPVVALLARRVAAVRIHAADADPRALESARRNLPASATLHQGVGFGALPSTLRGRIDVITAVPPYVPEGTEELMPREARDHEPHATRLGGPDGLDEVRHLSDEAPRWLAPGGELLIEMHHGQAHTMVTEVHGIQSSSSAGAAPQPAHYVDAAIIDEEDGSTAVLRLRV